MIANKLNIVKRAVKAAPLTYTEMDTNLTELVNVIDDVVNNYDAQALINAEFQDANDVQDLVLADLASDLTSGLNTKINTADIVDALTSTDATKVLSAKQGKALSDTVVANKSDADTKFADRYTKAQDDALLLTKASVASVDTLSGTVTTIQTTYNKLTLDTPQAATSGTSKDFVIPAAAKRISIMLHGVSTNGNSNTQIQIGSGSILATGYLGSMGHMISTGVGAIVYTTGFGIDCIGAPTVLSGTITLTHMGNNIWACHGTVSLANTAYVNLVSGSVALSGAIDRLRFTTVNGTDLFDLGVVNVLVEV